MFRLLRRKKRAVTIERKNSIPVIEKAIRRILFLQGKLADWMQQKSEQFSMRSKRLALVTFCIVVGSYSIFIIVNSVLSEQAIPIRAGSIRSPAFSDKTGEEHTTSDSLLHAKEYARIRKFRLYLDSLQSSTEGLKEYRLIMADRPGLMDSLLVIERMYQSQSK